MAVWILREAYINGEPFTMGGKNMRLEKVRAPEDPKPVEPEPSRPKPEAANVISLADLKKKR
jgi:hypothetical protein